MKAQNWTICERPDRHGRQSGAYKCSAIGTPGVDQLVTVGDWQDVRYH